MFKRFGIEKFAYAVCASALVVTTSAGHAKAQSSPPYALFQFASLTGSGNTITAANVPVITSPGVTVYETLTFQFNVDANGILTLTPGFPQAVPAPTIISSEFRAGTYVGPATLLGGRMLINVAGPGVTDGGATEWTLAAASGANSCTTPTTAAWYVGPITSNPWASRINAAGITSTAWSYGIAGGPNCNFTPVVANNWVNALIGVSQVGNTLTIASFTTGTGDTSMPVSQITFTVQ